MKKVMFLLATLFIGGILFTGCTKDPEPTPEPEPTPTTLTMVYVVDNTTGFSSLTMSPCFKLNVTYIDANGQEVTENGITLPWSKDVQVTSPFHAKMVAELTYNEAELPDPLVYGKYYGIGTRANGSLNIKMKGNGFLTSGKEKFLNLMALHPDNLQFTEEKDF